MCSLYMCRTANKKTLLLDTGPPPAIRRPKETRRPSPLLTLLLIFQQDSAPCQVASVVKKWLNSERIQLLDWPGNSPNLNPIENLWQIKEESPQPRTKEHA